MDNLRYGLRAERRIVALFRSFSWIAFATPGSRGPFDVIARSGDKGLVVQVKAVRTKTLRIADADHALRVLRERFDRHQARRLHAMANELRACPMAGLVNGGRIWLFHLDGGRFRLDFSVDADGANAGDPSSWA